MRACVFACACVQARVCAQVGRRGGSLFGFVCLTRTPNSGSSLSSCLSYSKPTHARTRTHARTHTHTHSLKHALTHLRQLVIILALYHKTDSHGRVFENGLHGACECLNTWVWVRVCVFTCTRACLYSRARARTHTHMRARAHTHTHTHTCLAAGIAEVVHVDVHLEVLIVRPSVHSSRFLNQHRLSVVLCVGLRLRGPKYIRRTAFEQFFEVGCSILLKIFEIVIYFNYRPSILGS